MRLTVGGGSIAVDFYNYCLTMSHRCVSVYCRGAVTALIAATCDDARPSEDLWFMCYKYAATPSSHQQV